MISRSVIVATFFLVQFSMWDVTAEQSDPTKNMSFETNMTLPDLPGIGSGTFTVVRISGSCTPIKAIITDPIDDDSCMRVEVESLLANMAITTRFVDERDPTETEMELGIGAVRVLGSTPGSANLNMTYDCPPDNYNGFSLQYGSYCVVSNNTQLWATISNYKTKRLHAIRVVLANTYPDVDTLKANEPPFGTAVFAFENGLDLSNVEPGQELALCEIDRDDDNVTCPELPENSGLETRLQYTANGFFGSNLLPGNLIIPGVWIQDDERQLLAGITSPSSSGGLQDFYFNGSGFFLHSYDSPGDAPDTCQWLPFCDYKCEVYNYDARFYDDLGTWRITWKLGQDQFDEQYSTESPALVRAYMGNAIDAAGVFPAVMYTNINQTAYLGLDKIGSSDVDEQPGYAFYWYTKYNLTVPGVEVFHPPDVCFGHEDFTFGGPTQSENMTTAPAAPSNAATNHGFSWRTLSWASIVLAPICLSLNIGFV